VEVGVELGGVDLGEEVLRGVVDDDVDLDALLVEVVSAASVSVFVSVLVSVSVSVSVCALVEDDSPPTVASTSPKTKYPK